MNLTLHNLAPGKQAKKKRKRVGRGNSSGRGNYSTRGMKGQRARSGGKGGLKKLGLKPVILATPKKKGIRSLRPKNQVVSLEDLNNFQEGETITIKALLKKGLLSRQQEPVKILNNGELKVKNLKVQKLKVSQSVKKQIEKLGGKVE